ncbi:MAG: DUF2520 domain-containing protein [Bacteroidota bacterium]|nr:DUF2520 domain-containing protein [Bacteroidota bacterium]
MNVSFIGSGNLAWHLAPAFDNTDFQVREVYSRNARNAEKLVDRLYHARVQSTLDFSSSSSRIFVIAVSDDAIDDIVGEIVLPDDSILLHTSGSQPLNVLAYAATSSTGVFYPLQTFSKHKKVDFNEVPVFVESEDSATEQVMLQMARAISRKVHRISSEQRLTLHLAAVFASNFTNHMLTISRDILQTRKLEFEWLKPLIAEQINKSLTVGPEEAQTGPARRGDLEVLDRHVSLLSNDDAVAGIYRAVSQHIVDRYHQ